MTRTLITGANKGLGYETARRLLADGHDVWVAARDPERGAEAAESLGARFVTLDVTDGVSVAAAADVVAKQGGLDVLVNNAGIVGPRSHVPETTAEDMHVTFETNVFGPVRVLRAFTGLLDASAAPSSSMSPVAWGRWAMPATRPARRRTSCCWAIRRLRPRSTC